MNSSAQIVDEVVDEPTAGWEIRQIQEVAEVNPRIDKKAIPDDMEVSFVPMPAVEAESGEIDVSQIKLAKDAKKGFTAFLQGDVLFAKITPCMENGKMAIAPALVNDYGFGSTEFHVLRPRKGMDAKYLYYYVSSKSFRGEAERFMTGAVGQKRVPTTYIKEAAIPVAPIEDQRRIVAEIEKQFSRLDEAVASLKHVKANLKRYKAAVLKAAVDGKLTEEWRKQNPDVEPASKLLERILAERRKKWEEAELAKMNAKDKELKNDKWRERYKAVDELNWIELPALPKGWCWVRFEQILESLCNGISTKPDKDDGLAILRISAVRPLNVNLDDVRYLPSESASDYERFQIRDGDLLFTRYNGNPDFVGVCGAVKNVSAFIVHPDKLMKGTVINEDDIKPNYLELALNTGESRAYITSMVRTTAGQSGVSGADIKNVPVPIPPSKEQDLIVQLVEKEVSIIVSIERHLFNLLQRAEQLRQSILSKAFNGEIIA